VVPIEKRGERVAGEGMKACSQSERGVSVSEKAKGSMLGLARVVFDEGERETGGKDTKVVKGIDKDAGLVSIFSMEMAKGSEDEVDDGGEDDEGIEDIEVNMGSNEWILLGSVLD
jgi:hypothetical protein